uniref:AlNc14C86G5493 protein n=1 Tax=Albugo laibachii Nc14 TaxID=890382 RepID=F0WFV8_9STRA|nr:AlNc14C86G5493 [Albugo laibachii Nc14]|eukprot:CCA20092.1 AlNc14C86G5493 [Albugo laibachii Nc14]
MPEQFSNSIQDHLRTVRCNAFTSFDCPNSDLRTFCFIEQNRIELARCKVYATSISSLGLVFLANMWPKRSLCHTLYESLGGKGKVTLWTSFLVSCFFARFCDWCLRDTDKGSKQAMIAVVRY